MKVSILLILFASRCSLLILVFFFFFLRFFSLSGGKLSDLISLLPISQFIRTVFGMLYSNECRIVGGCFTAHKNSLVQVFYREFLTFPLYGY